MLKTEYRYMKEALEEITKSQNHEELNRIAYKYWGTKKAPIRKIENIKKMELAVQERRSIIGNKMGGNEDTERMENNP